jgi:hypothetical protein
MQWVLITRWLVVQLYVNGNCFVSADYVTRTFRSAVLVQRVCGSVEQLTATSISVLFKYHSRKLVRELGFLMMGKNSRVSAS